MSITFLGTQTVKRCTTLDVIVPTIYVSGNRGIRMVAEITVEEKLEN